MDSLILSWVPLGSLVGGGWDLAGGLAKGLGGWGGHLDGISLKEFAGRGCREMSLGKYRGVEGGISQMLCVARQGAKRNRWLWLWLWLWLVRTWESGKEVTAGYFWHLWLVRICGLNMRPHFGLELSDPQGGSGHDDRRVHLQLDSALSAVPQNTFLHKRRDNSTTTYKMAITPIITFKAGKIDLDVRPFILCSSALLC